LLGLHELRHGNRSITNPIEELCQKHDGALRQPSMRNKFRIIRRRRNSRPKTTFARTRSPRQKSPRHYSIVPPNCRHPFSPAEVSLKS
jgi:hypothetical protein